MDGLLNIMEISIDENDEGVFLYIPGFRYGKGFALPYGPISDDAFGLNLPEYDSQTLNEAGEGLDELNLIKPSTSQLIHTLSFIPLIPDERIQNGLVSMLRTGIFSFDRCFLDPNKNFYLTKKGSYNERGPFLRGDLHSQRSPDIRRFPLGKKEQYGRWKNQKIDEFRYGNDEIFDFLIGQEGIEDLKAFLSYSATSVLKSHQPRGNSDQELDGDIAVQLVECLIGGLPPYYNYFQPNEVESRLVMDEPDCYIGNSVEGQIFFKGEKRQNFKRNDDPDYIPQLDANAAVILNVDFYKDSPEEARGCYSLGIIR